MEMEIMWWWWWCRWRWCELIFFTTFTSILSRMGNNNKEMDTKKEALLLDFQLPDEENKTSHWILRSKMGVHEAKESYVWVVSHHVFMY